MVMSRRSVSLTKPHFFQGKLRLNSKPVLSAHTFTRNQQQSFLNQENDYIGFIQASLNKIQGLFKTILQFSRTKSLGTRNVSMGYGCPHYCQIRINRELSLTKGNNSLKHGAI